MDAQVKAPVTCTATIDKNQVPSPLRSNGFTYALLIYSNTNPSLITFLTLILLIKVPQSLFVRALKPDFPRIFVRVSSCSNIKPFEGRGFAVFSCVIIGSDKRLCDVFRE
jgi:hypothetical protein